MPGSESSYRSVLKKAFYQFFVIQSEFICRLTKNTTNNMRPLSNPSHGLGMKGQIKGDHF